MATINQSNHIIQRWNNSKDTGALIFQVSCNIGRTNSCFRITSGIISIKPSLLAPLPLPSTKGVVVQTKFIFSDTNTVILLWNFIAQWNLCLKIFIFEFMFEEIVEIHVPTVNSQSPRQLYKIVNCFSHELQEMSQSRDECPQRNWSSIRHIWGKLAVI